jgi:hypothetical protein
MSEHDPQPGLAGPAPAAFLFTRPAWVRILPFAAYMLFIVIADGLDRLGWAADSLRWLYGVKVATVALILLIFWREYAELRRFDFTLKRAATAVLVGLAVFVLWISLNADWMIIGHPTGFDPRSDDGRIDWALVGLRVAGAALVVPVMEELFWRSYLMRWIDASAFLAVNPRGLSFKALLVSSVLFAVEHNHWLAGVVAGLAYGWLYRRMASLWTVVLAHGVTNLVLGVWIVRAQQWTYW